MIFLLAKAVCNDYFKQIMNANGCFRKLRLTGSLMLSFAVAAMMAGCEGEKDDPTGAEQYFKANPYESAERTEMAVVIKIAPTVAAISIIGQEVVFTVSGGEGNYHWSLANYNLGGLNERGANQCVYQCKVVGNNDIVVQDDAGHYAAAHIAPKIDEMTVTPSDVTLAAGELYVAFSVEGGTSPYTWTSGNVSMGTVSYSAATSYTAGYTAIAGMYGKNTVTVRDAEGRVKSAIVTQSAP